jgi:hypothetical protein
MVEPNCKDCKVFATDEVCQLCIDGCMETNKGTTDLQPGVDAPRTQVLVPILREKVMETLLCYLLLGSSTIMPHIVSHISNAVVNGEKVVIYCVTYFGINYKVQLSNNMFIIAKL